MNEIMHVEALALDLAYSRSSINDLFPSFPLLADTPRILHSSSLPSILTTGRKEERTHHLYEASNESSFTQAALAASTGRGRGNVIGKIPFLSGDRHSEPHDS